MRNPQKEKIFFYNILRKHNEAYTDGSKSNEMKVDFTVVFPNIMKRRTLP